MQLIAAASQTLVLTLSRHKIDASLIVVASGNLLFDCWVRDHNDTRKNSSVVSPRGTFALGGS